MTLTRDVVIIGSGAAGGTVAQALAPLVRAGLRVTLFEQGAQLDDAEFTGRELEMANALFEDGGGVLTADGAMTLAFGRAYGGSTVTYTGTSLVPDAHVFERWAIPTLTHADVTARAARYATENGVHFLRDDEINENNARFADGCRAVGLEAGRFPVNTRGCRGSGLCNLGCPNAAKQGTHRVQLPAAETAGVEVVTRAEVLRVGEREVTVRVSARPPGAKGRESTWAPGEYVVRAAAVVSCGGSMGSTALLLRSGLARALPQLGERYTCHPAHILVAEHAQPIVNDVGFPKSYFLDRPDEGFILETCMYFPFITAKNLTGFGADHQRFLDAFPRLQMILVMAHDRPVPGNRITIDTAGRPVVHYTFTPAVREALVRATRLSARIFFGAGAVRVHAPSADPPLLTRDDLPHLDTRVHARHFLTHRISVSSAHMMGGCGMGADARTSVTDAWGRAHGLPWLRVADSALFPDSSDVNPYLTVMALADRAAEALTADLGALRAGADA
ncbi:MAG: GMC family oxidoreductase [Gemmatimonadetes bacterium]|nr:GMC family oxidoreductase [Gemmatimonadota bacterium]